jgi:hypothetical protein
MDNKPPTVRITQILFFLNAAIWLFFGIYRLLRLEHGGNIPQMTVGVIIVLMFGNALVMFFTGIWLGRQSKWAFFLALAVLTVNILLTFTDQVGFFDIATAMLDFLIIGLLFYDRKDYLYR